MRKFEVNFRRDNENDVMWSTDAVLNPDEEFLIKETILTICQTIDLLYSALDAFESKNIEEFKSIFKILQKRGDENDVQQNIKSVQDNLKKFRAIESFSVEIDEKTKDFSIGMVSFPLNCLNPATTVDVTFWNGNLNALKAAYKNFA